MIGVRRFLVVIVLLAMLADLSSQCECNAKNQSGSVVSTGGTTSKPGANKQSSVSRGRGLDLLSPSAGEIFRGLGNVGQGEVSQDEDREDNRAKPSQTKPNDFEMPFVGLFNNLVPAPLKSFLPLQLTTTTTTITTTTPLPIVELNQNAFEIGLGLTSALNAPMKVINGLTKVSSKGVNRAADRLVKSTSNVVESVDTQQGRLSSMVSGSEWVGGKLGPIDDSMYYEFSPSTEPFAERKPKYFSRECQFRFACEVGRVMKPFTKPVAGVAAQNKLLLDLQNRYTRALTYGNLYDSCERYYCVLVQLMGGPAGFASGVSEIVNRLMNGDAYEGFGAPLKR